MIELMCDCLELQNGHVFKIGDCVYDNSMMDIFSWERGRSNQGGGYIWIPTQEQIQRMLMKKWLCNNHYVRTEFNRWYSEFMLPNDMWQLTGNEVWIAFYMHRVHNKIWKWRTKKKQWKEV